MTEEQFNADELVPEAVIRQISVIGEAAKRVSGTITGMFPDFPWSNFAKTRDLVMHQYDRVDYGIIWDSAKNECPIYEQYIKKVVSYLRDELKFSELWYGLSLDKRNLLEENPLMTVVGVYEDEEYLLQCSEHRLYAAKCSDISFELSSTRLFTNPNFLLNKEETNKLSHGKSIRIEKWELRYDVKQRKVIFSEVPPPSEKKKPTIRFKR